MAESRRMINIASREGRRWERVSHGLGKRASVEIMTSRAKAACIEERVEIACSAEKKKSCHMS